MDLPSTTQKEFERALRDIEWVNKYLGGAKALIAGVNSVIKGSPACYYSVLDLGTGGADLPVALVKWGKGRKISFKITAIDKHPWAVESGSKFASNFPEIEVIEGDALNLSYPNESFDIVISSMLMHHFDTKEAACLLQEMARICRLGFVVNDLERNLFAYLGIYLTGKLGGKGRIFQHDAPASVLNGFVPEDILCLKELSGLSTLQLFYYRPYRIVLTWPKSTRVLQKSPSSASAVSLRCSAASFTSVVNSLPLLLASCLCSPHGTFARPSKEKEFMHGCI